MHLYILFYIGEHDSQQTRERRREDKPTDLQTHRPLDRHIHSQRHTRNVKYVIIYFSQLMSWPIWALQPTQCWAEDIETSGIQIFRYDGIGLHLGLQESISVGFDDRRERKHFSLIEQKFFDFYYWPHAK